MGQRTIEQSPIYTIKEIHERLSRYFDILDLDHPVCKGFTDPLDFVCHEVWKRRIKEDHELHQNPNQHSKEEPASTLQTRKHLD